MSHDDALATKSMSPVKMLFKTKKPHITNQM